MSDLLAGDPAALRALGLRASRTADGLLRAAGAVRDQIGTGSHWRGPAATAFLTTAHAWSSELLAAADCHAEAAAAILGFADTLQTAQHAAAAARRLTAHADTASASWRARRSVELGAAVTADGAEDPSLEPEPARSLRLRAAAMSQTAFDDVATAARKANAALDDARDALPRHGRHGLASLRYFAADVGYGAARSAVGVAHTVWDLGLSWSWDPSAWHRHAAGAVIGLARDVANPVDTVRTLIDWQDLAHGHPGRAIGSWLPTVAASLAGGAGAEARVARGADAARYGGIGREGWERRPGERPIDPPPRPLRPDEHFPVNFDDVAQWRAFMAALYAKFDQQSLLDVVPLFQGSAVTGRSFSSGLYFDVNRTSDLDIALVSATLWKRAQEIGVKFQLNSGPMRSRPLTRGQARRLGLEATWWWIRRKTGREQVHFMLFHDVDEATKRPSLTDQR